MRTLGVDPGTIRTGWGVVESRGSQLTPIASGVISLPKNLPLSLRLQRIHHGLVSLIDEYQPTSIAIEEVFFAKFPNAALKLGHARGVALLVAANAELEVHSYAATVVKKSVTGQGRAAKEQVSQMVRALLGLDTDSLPEDATDALAIAITHLQASTMRSQVLQAQL